MTVTLSHSDNQKLANILSGMDQHFGADLSVGVVSNPISLELEVNIAGIGSFLFKGEDAIAFLNTPAEQVAKRLKVSKAHLLAFYIANNNDLNICQAITKNGKRCSRACAKPALNIADFLPGKTYLCRQHENCQ